jgi:hypothetical protein
MTVMVVLRMSLHQSRPLFSDVNCYCHLITEDRENTQKHEKTRDF